MAFTFTMGNENVEGDLRFTSGTYTSAGGATGGNIYTGLQKAEGMFLLQKGSAVIASQAVVNEVFPKSDPITIVTAANGTGYWIAFGH